MLLAEELLVLRMGPELEGRVEDSVETGLVAALVSELILIGRVAVEWQTELGDNAISIIDGEPLGDDLLDEVVLLLRGGRTDASRQLAQHPKAPRGVVARHVRRRIRARGRVSEKDLAYWWYGAWKCAWLEGLAPTLLYQLLMLHEGINRMLPRVRGRLSANDVLTYRGGDAAINITVYRDLRDRPLPGKRGILLVSAKVS